MSRSRTMQKLQIILMQKFVYEHRVHTSWQVLIHSPVFVSCATYRPARCCAGFNTCL